MKPIKVAILTEIISPYRIPVFNCLASHPELDLTILFFSKTESRRDWQVPTEKIKFTHKVLGGFLVSRRYQNGPVFFNPNILIALFKEGYDCIIVGGYHHPTTWIALGYARVTQTRCLLWSESTLRDQRSQNKIKEKFKRFLVQQASEYIVPGKAQMRYIAALGAPPNRVWTVPNSVEATLFSQAASQLRSQKEIIKQELGIEGQVLLFVGRLIDDKGIPDLLDAYEHIIQSLKVTLILVGDGPDREKYVADCQQRNLKGVYFAGFQEQEELPKYYAIADLFVFPTYSDPWGLVLNEAMHAGLPIVCSQAAGAAEDLVRDGDNGFLYEPGDVRSLIHYLLYLLQTPMLRQKMGEKSLQIIERYTPEKMAQGFADAILSTPLEYPSATV